ncbi:hypothetical protein ISF_09983 [Cordyceps fumosorosea ARSEF 2679]|uniref:Uncharacterized protein n=1 Tax=Cordyceps fumosorosea (strain ARSEF 2679) TaxID=1081104 RepID=A0A166X9R0_CORFA|nr:hypothetical protein ISF_09983 [Cordyceps fumosorosea ARSEF 2679]OAA35577.1 hypothetical protein ISF_09983 [Cordyceps fumosorosea ARSEF 2679]
MEGLGIGMLRCKMQGCSEIQVRRVRLRTDQQQLANDGDIACGSSIGHGCRTERISGRHIQSVARKRMSRRRIAASDSLDQWCGAVIVYGICVGAEAEKKLNNVGAGFLSCKVEGPGAVLVGNVFVCFSFQETLANFIVASSNGAMQRRHIVVPFFVWVEARI